MAVFMSRMQGDKKTKSNQSKAVVHALKYLYQHIFVNPTRQSPHQQFQFSHLMKTNLIDEFHQQTIYKEGKKVVHQNLSITQSYYIISRVYIVCTGLRVPPQQYEGECALLNKESINAINFLGDFASPLHSRILPEIKSCTPSNFFLFKVKPNQIRDKIHFDYKIKGNLLKNDETKINNLSKKKSLKIATKNDK